MYLKKKTESNGDIYLSVMEKYYDRSCKTTRERTVEGIGHVSELQKRYKDPISYFTQYAKDLTDKKKGERSRTITIDTSETLTVGTCDTRNAGYGILKSLYKDLELDKFWNWKTRGKMTKVSTDQIFRLLTFSRALQPGAKRYTLNNKDFFFEPFDGFSLDDIYHALDIIAENQEALQQWIFDHSKKICERDVSVSYFDCTNYYFDISHPDVDELDDDGNPVDKDGNPVAAKYRKRGPEKNHRPDPIVGMGLLMDRSGIPIAYDLFAGNESEKVHMRPIINRVKKEFDNSRIIYVADRGLNTSDNIYWLNGDNKGDYNQRDEYVYGQSVRGADEEFKKWVLSGGYRTDKTKDDDGKEVLFHHKSRIFPKELHVNVTKPGSKKPVKKTVVVDQKQMVYYSEKYVKKNISFSKETGEIVDGKVLKLDLEKIQEEELYDGYYSIVTSELEMSDAEMRKVYSGLAKIEASFNVTKTYFNSRPVYVWLNEHIDAHFATCFLALVLIRLLEHKLEYRFSTGKILNSLKKYNCTHVDANNWQFTYYDEIIDACGQALDMDLNNKHRTQQEVQRMLRY